MFKSLLIPILFLFSTSLFAQMNNFFTVFDPSKNPRSRVFDDTSIAVQNSEDQSLLTSSVSGATTSTQAGISYAHINGKYAYTSNEFNDDTLQYEDVEQETSVIGNGAEFNLFMPTKGGVLSGFHIRGNSLEQTIKDEDVLEGHYDIKQSNLVVNAIASFGDTSLAFGFTATQDKFTLNLSSAVSESLSSPIVFKSEATANYVIPEVSLRQGLTKNFSIAAFFSPRKHVTSKIKSEYSSFDASSQSVISVKDDSQEIDTFVYSRGILAFSFVSGSKNTVFTAGATRYFPRTYTVDGSDYENTGMTKSCLAFETRVANTISPRIGAHRIKLEDSHYTRAEAGASVQFASLSVEMSIGYTRGVFLGDNTDDSRFDLYSGSAGLGFAF